jgi:RNA polymerase sigma-70 factor, ECF subfamily
MLKAGKYKYRVIGRPELLPKKYENKVEELYHKYSRDMLYTAVDIVRDFSQAEDIVHIAFIKIMKHIEKISIIPDDEVKGYIICIVKNLAVDILRKNKKIVPYDEYEIADENEESVENMVIFNLELDFVKRKLKEMDDKYSLPLILKYTLGFSHAEIADLLSLSVEDARVRCHRGRRRLIKAIGKEAVRE